VTSADIASNTILGGNIVNGTIGTNDIGDGEVRGADIASDFNHAYTAHGANPLAVSVPAGQYVVVGQTTLGNGDDDPQEAVCSLQGQEVLRESLNGFTQDTVPITGTATLASPGSITISCGGFAAMTQNTRLTVTRVNGVN
jgi:hypothetical protein